MTTPPNTKRRPDQVDLAVGVRVRSLRKVRGITQSQLAEAMGLSFQQLQKYEKGQSRMSVGVLVQIAEALDANLGELVDAAAAQNEAMAKDDLEALTTAFAAIKDDRLRRTVLDLVTRMAATQ